jgi:hypothetical protein
MSDSFRGEVLYALSPDELDEDGLTDELRELATAESSHVLVCRRGGHPSLLARIWAFVRREPIEAVTIVADDGVAVGEQITVTVEETSLPGVYRATSDPTVD